MQRFNPFPKVNGSRGAPMGRMSANLGLDPENDRPEALGVAGPAYEYDSGGAYWGLPAGDGPVWAVWRKGKGREGVEYVRARSREEAKRVALADG